MGDFFPHILEVDLPLIILKLGADFFYFLVDLFAIKINLPPSQLSVQFIIQLLLEPGFKHVEQMTDLAFVLDNDLINSFSELADEGQGLTVA